MMLPVRHLAFAIVATLALCGSTLQAAPTLTSGISFQNEGTLQADQTATLATLDDDWAPTTSGTAVFDYYATGSSQRYWDAISLTFDVTGVADPGSLDLRFYIQQGGYSDPSWRHYLVLPGASNSAYEDDHAGDVPGATQFPVGYEGWICEPVPAGSVSGDTVNVTLRLWNARIDAVELTDACTAIPAPGAILLGTLGTGLVGVVRRRRMR